MSQRALPSILVVEDDLDLRQTIVASLEANGFAAAQASDAADAIERLRSFAYDGLVVDLRLPDADGMTGTRRSPRSLPADSCGGDDRVRRSRRSGRRDQERGGGLPHQAVPAVAAGARAANRPRAAAVARGERGTQGAAERQVPLREHHRPSQHDAGALHDARARVADEQHGADQRRDGYRQGAHRAHDSSQQPAGERALRRLQRRGHSGNPRRGRAVRSRQGRVHGCDRLARGTLRAGPSRHALHRRSGVDVAAAAGQAAARAAGARDRARRRVASDAPGHPRRRRKQPGPAEDGQGRDVPRGPLLPAERHSRDAARAPAAA